jgi:hypothetical protein
MEAPPRQLEDLELALLRRSVDDLVTERDPCERCRRTPLVGERVFSYSSGAVLCALCKPNEREALLHSRLVHGPELGQTIRITDHRAAA